MRKVLTPQERICLHHWLRHRRTTHAPNLIALPEYPGRADRYYAGLAGIVAVEVTRLVDPEKERAEADSRRFLRNDIAPLVAGRLPAKYFATLDPPWDVPPKGSRDRRELALAVASRIIVRAPDTSAQLTDASLPPYVRLSLIRASTQSGFRGVVYGGMSSLYGGWEGQLREAAKLAVERAISNKAAKRQLEGSGIARRILLLHDLMDGAEPDVLADVVSTLPRAQRAAFDEIVVVSVWNQGACYIVSLN